MKTIEERAKEYEQSLGYYDCMNQWPQEAFIAGAKSEHEELTRWNSPECPPMHENEVLMNVKTAPDIYNYIVGCFRRYTTHAEWETPVWFIDFDKDEILGWREIHE